MGAACNPHLRPESEGQRRPPNQDAGWRGRSMQKGRGWGGPFSSKTVALGKLSQKDGMRAYMT